MLSHLHVTYSVGVLYFRIAMLAWSNRWLMVKAIQDLI